LNVNREPSLVFITLAGLTILPLTAAKAWRDDPMHSPLSAEAIAQHAITLLLQGVGPQPPAKKTR
jgi:TetR/AcrR family transcriptional regulator